MSGFNPQAPADLDLTVVEINQPPGTISPLSIQRIIDSLSSMFSFTVAAGATLTAAQRGSRLRFGGTAPGTVFIPSNTSVPLNVNVVYSFCQIGTGVLSVSGATNVSLYSPNVGPTASISPRSPYSHIWIIQDSPNNWIAGGDLA